METRTYMNLKRRAEGEGFCRRCNCSSDLGNHWLDVKQLSFHKPEQTERILESCFPADLPLRALPGYHVDMEQADLLHALYLGAGKDCVGSVMLDVVQYDQRFAEIPSLEEGLQALCSLFHSWAEENGMDKSIIDEIRALSAKFAFSMKGSVYY